MISQETKDQIDKESRTYLNEGNRKTYVIAATKYAEYKAQLEEKKDKLFDDLLAENVKILEDVNYYKAISDRATKYAEKLEEKDKEIESLTTCIIKAENGWAKSQSVTIDLQEFLRKFIAAFDKGSSDDYNLRDEAQLLLSKKWPEIKFADNAQLESRDRELAQLKEIAEKVAKALSYWDRTFKNDDYSLFQSLPTKDSFWRPDDEIKKTTESLTAYAEWCKQNLK